MRHGIAGLVSECELKLQELEEHWDSILSNPGRCGRQAGEEGGEIQRLNGGRIQCMFERW